MSFGPFDLPPTCIGDIYEYNTKIEASGANAPTASSVAVDTSTSTPITVPSNSPSAPTILKPSTPSAPSAPSTPSAPLASSVNTNIVRQPNLRPFTVTDEPCEDIEYDFWSAICMIILLFMLTLIIYKVVDDIYQRYYLPSIKSSTSKQSVQQKSNSANQTATPTSTPTSASTTTSNTKPALGST